jgi:hypothetical protein
VYSAVNASTVIVQFLLTPLLLRRLSVRAVYAGLSFALCGAVAISLVRTVVVGDSPSDSPSMGDSRRDGWVASVLGWGGALKPAEAQASSRLLEMATPLRLATLSYGLLKVLHYSIGNSAAELCFAGLTFEEKFHGKRYIQVFAYRVAKGVTAAALAAAAMFGGGGTSVTVHNSAAFAAVGTCAMIALNRLPGSVREKSKVD